MKHFFSKFISSKVRNIILQFPRFFSQLLGVICQLMIENSGKIRKLEVSIYLVLEAFFVAFFVIVAGIYARDAPDRWDLEVKGICSQDMGTIRGIAEMRNPHGKPRFTEIYKCSRDEEQFGEEIYIKYFVWMF